MFNKSLYLKAGRLPGIIEKIYALMGVLEPKSVSLASFVSRMTKKPQKEISFGSRSRSSSSTKS